MAQHDKHTPIYSIGTVASMLGISVQTIRLYEQRGLLVVEKSEGNQRRYSQSDVERLECIRKTINEEKISIEGIRRIHSMIPCWEHIQCPMEQRIVCPAYMRHDAGCWTYKHQSNICSQHNCRDCAIYQQSVDCNNIKSLIRKDPQPLHTIETVIAVII